MQGGKRNTAAAQAWHDALRGIGCIATNSREVAIAGVDIAPVHIHHLEGSTFKHKGVHIGNWLVLPVHSMLHGIESNHQYNVTYHKHKFYEKYGSPDVLLLEARSRVLAQNPDATVIPEAILELAHDLYEPKEITDWYAKLGITEEQEKAA